MKIKQYFQSLQFKLFVLLIVVAVIPVTITAIINQQSTIRLLDVEVKERQTEALQIIVNQVSDFVQSIVIDLESIGQVTHELNLTDDSLKQFLISNLITNVDAADTQLRYDSIWVMDNEGNELGAIIGGRALPTDALTNRHEDEIFFRAERGEIYYSNVRLIEGSPQISIAIPIVSNEVFVGVVAAVISLEKPWETIRAAQFGANGYAMLVDQRGSLIVHRDSDVIARRVNLASSPAFVSASNSSQGTLIQEYYSPISGDVVGNAQRIVGPNWTLIVERPRNEAFVAEIVANQNALFSMALSIILAVILSIVVARQITRPIVELRDIAYHVQEGDLSLRAKVHSSDEIGVLAQTFNSMTEQLSQLIANLEQRVAARTHDLQIAADVSTQLTTILDLNELLPQVAAQTCEGYDLYHASVYLFNVADNTLNLKASVGRQGLVFEEGSLAFELSSQGFVPKSARDKHAVVANDVTADSSHYKNPKLPETQSELSIPMLVGQRLIGVLDLQSEQKNRFMADDIRVLTTLATQIGIAVGNAQSYTEAAEARRLAEESNQVKTQFLANMSHELRTPLNAILNFTAFVSDGVLGPVNDRQVSTLQKAVQAGKHLLSLINDILDITKIEAGLMDLFIEQVDMNEILSSIASIGKGLGKDKSVDLITQIDEAMPATYGDKRRLRQVFLNLVSNAMKFTTEGSVIIAAQAKENVLHITIKDTGIGIAPENHAAVFEAFRQAKHELPETVGTGLGMPISKFFVESHQGRIWFESKLGSGTTFYVELPILSQTEAESILSNMPAYA